MCTSDAVRRLLSETCEGISCLSSEPSALAIVALGRVIPPLEFVGFVCRRLSIQIATGLPLKLACAIRLDHELWVASFTFFVMQLD